MTITVTYTPVLNKNAFAERVWHTTTRSWLHYTKLAALLLCAWALVNSRTYIVFHYLWYLLLAIAIFLLMDGPAMVYAWLRWKEQPAQRMPRTCVFSAEGMVITVSDVTRQVTWAECPGYREEKDCFIVYTSDKGDYIIPPKAALEPEIQDQLRALLEGNLPRLRRVIL